MMHQAFGYGGPTANWHAQQIDLGGVNYPYCFGHDCVDRIAWSIGRLDADLLLVVTDDTVVELHGETLLPALADHSAVEVLSHPAGEQIKTYSVLGHYLDRAIEAGATRRSVVVAFGGGVPGNLAGLVAALLYRGVRFIQVPTTTVAAMDSTISLKQAINSTRGKNHIGTYYAPEAVYTDVQFLRTLPARELRSGMSEAVKNCLAIRPESIDAMRRLLSSPDPVSPENLLWLLSEGIAAKTAVTVQDPKEQGSGLVLEYGHTIGHAVELCDNQLRGPQGISHGEAVAMGMLAAARISRARGDLSQAEVHLHEELIRLVGAAESLPSGITTRDVMEKVAGDNKRGYLPLSKDEAAMVLLRGLGQPMGTPGLPLSVVPLELIADTVSSLVTT